jgi:iron complex transport system ATP-binding protein
MAPAPALEIIGAHAGYPASTPRPGEVLRGVSVAVEPGEILALLGPNGAGKTTLLRVAAGALAPRRGEVRLAGAHVAGMDRRALARQVAVVAQSEPAAEGFSVREVVMMGRAPHQGAWLAASAEDRAVVDDALTRCDLTAIADRPAGQLSGGELKRVTIARALAQRPRVLLLDEPGAFLDVRHQIDLYEMLADEVSRSALACIVVMHDLNVAAQYATRVALMKQGEIVAIGSVEEVMTYRRLRETFDADLYCGENELDRTRYFVPMRRGGRPPPGGA